MEKNNQNADKLLLQHWDDCKGTKYSLFVSRSKLENCTCQCSRHRREAKRQSDVIFEGRFFQKKPGKCGRIQDRAEIETHLTVEELLGKKRTCVLCTCIFLLLAGDARGEGIAEAFLSRKYPLASQNARKRSNELHVCA